MLVLKNVRVLIVDDHEDCRILLTFILEAEGAQVTATASANEAFSSLNQRCPDILISDIVMPKLDGYALIKKIRACQQKQTNSILAIALTAMAGAESHQKALSAGFHCCLFKPIEPSALINEIIQLKAACK